MSIKRRIVVVIGSALMVVGSLGASAALSTNTALGATPLCGHGLGIACHIK